MFAAFTPVLTFLAAAAIYVRADPNPNNPGPGDVFIQGQACPVGWDVDTTGLWKTMNIDLMTGDNFNMVLLTSVASGIDGTNPMKNTYSFTCPQVTPHSPIYFYQFSSPSTSNRTWTGRFTITDSAKNIVAPSQPTQPDGEKIPWGTGSLAEGSSSAAPSASTQASLAPGPVTASVTSASNPGSPSFTSPSIVTSIVQITGASATPSTVSTTEASGGASLFSVPNIVFHTGVALGLAAFGFAAMF
ncbi:hypothetical protein L210DRAFT_3756645 [Boletus edulis BED1]|uniref:Yeast cell wall synthesis Kre9/Knh1-like N-terminal domain-containing protein n=1 Tax=Boletus edulis BED1 TaxID=1328754 RepID=A0AAD4GK25_BOLED|nr:hypothetical protein L210DRAFT_3756645 [Boletus edulis BED1]